MTGKVYFLACHLACYTAPGAGRNGSVDIVTVLGITWHKASGEEILLAIGLLMVPVAVIILFKGIQKLKNRRIHEEQLFLFKLKRLGLSNFQTKIVNNLIEILGFSNPNQLFENTEYFETAIGSFMTHTRATNESADSQLMMCRDITAVYDKLYFNNLFKKPLKTIEDVDEDQLIYFSPVAGRAFLGKIISRDTKNLYLSIFGRPGDLAGVPLKKPVTFQMFRVGDAEYEFISLITGRSGATLYIDTPAGLVRKEESRHPYIDVIIPAHLSKIIVPLKDKELVELEEIIERDEAPTKEDVAGDEGMVLDETAGDRVECTIYKINDYEAVIRISDKLDFGSMYYLEFTVMDFSFKIISHIIATKSVEESGAQYYTVKFQDMSASAASVLKKYVYEHL
jgi:hypothetical protein